MVKLPAFLLLLAAVCPVGFAQPPGKHWEAVAYNERTHELAVFSGAEFTDNKMHTTDSLWLFNGKWRFVDDNSITGRWAHSLVYHANTLYVYGGLAFNAQQQETLLSDLYRYQGSWRKVTEGPRLSLPALFSANGKLILAGQLQEDKKRFEVWELTSETFQRRSSAVLPSGADGLRTLLVKNDFVVVYPADSGLVFQNVSTGQATTVKELPKRSKYGLTYHSQLGSYFLFGGMDETRNFSNDLWRIKDGLAQKVTAENLPSPRASCSLLPTAQGLLLYGGTESGGKLSNALWQYDNGKWICVDY